MRSCLAAIVVGLLSLSLWAQTNESSVTGPQSESTAGRTGPTKVTGAPTSKPDGLQYWDIKLGDGKTAAKGSVVTVDYTGWLKNGTKFDSSRDRGQPFSFTLGGGQVIKGWEEGIASMKVGGKRRLEIPPDLGYGTSGFPGAIPPNATLIYDVELKDARGVSEQTPESQEYFNKGLHEAHNEEWTRAARYCEEARKISPNSSEVLFNLALAESKIPGREPSSISWFHAYLSSTSNPSNAKQVQSEISQLEFRVRDEVTKLLQVASDLATQFPRANISGYDWDSRDFALYARDIRLGQAIGAPGYGFSGVSWTSQNLALYAVAVTQAESGDISAAYKTFGLIGRDKQPIYRDEFYGNVAVAQAFARNFSAALSTLTPVFVSPRSNPDVLAFAYGKIAEEQARTGDFAGALETASRIPEDSGGAYYKLGAYAAIHSKQVIRGDYASAHRTALLARAAAEKSPTPKTYESFLDSVCASELPKNCLVTPEFVGRPDGI